MRKIRLFHPFVDKETIEEVTKILSSGWLGLGPKVEEFEDKFSKYLNRRDGQKNLYCVATNSATSALHVAYCIANLEGKKVITTPITFVSTNHVLLHTRAEPIFSDVDRNMNLDVDKLILQVTDPKIKAIVVVHYAGNPVDVHSLRKMLKDINREDIEIIEDAAHAAGSEYKYRDMVGSSGNDCCFSFHAVKNIGIGDGGVYCTINKERYELAKKLVWLGINKSTYSRSAKGDYKWLYNVEELGYKYHMNDISATIALGALKNLDSNNIKRRKIAELYDKEFNEIGIEHIEKNSDCISYHLYFIKIDHNRDEFVDYMGEKGITCGVHYYPNHLYGVYKKYYRSLPVAEAEWQRLVSIPIHPMMEIEDAECVVDQIKKFIEK